MSQLPEIIRTIDRVSADVVAKASTYQAAILADVAGRRGTMHARVAPVHQDMKVAGPAFTVEVRPGDNLMIHAAIAMAKPGDVLVIDGSADLTRAVFGGIMRAMALPAGIVGVVINGALRDLDEWQTGELPAYAIGGVHRGPSTDGGGEINVPISCAGMLVMPGDLMIGDGDGVVAASRSELPELLIRCHDLLAREQATLKAIEEGTLDPDRFDAILRAKGCPV